MDLVLCSVLSWFSHICLIWLAGDIKLGNSQIGVTKSAPNINGKLGLDPMTTLPNPYQHRQRCRSVAGRRRERCRLDHSRLRRRRLSQCDATLRATLLRTRRYTTLRSRRLLLQRCCSAAAARRRLPKRLQLQPTRRRRRRRLLRVEWRPARLARFVADALARALAQPIHILWGGRTSTAHTRVVLRNRQVRPPHTVVLTGEVPLIDCYSTVTRPSREVILVGR